jgi:hypothetical protein
MLVLLGIVMLLGGATPLPPARAVSAPAALVLTGPVSVSVKIPYLPPPVATTQTFALTGLATMGVNVTIENCMGSLDGIEMLVAGNGSWTANCSGFGPIGSIVISGCTGTYARVATELVMLGTCTISTVSVVWTGIFQWVPTNAPVDPRFPFCDLYVCSVVLGGAVVVGPGI